MRRILTPLAVLLGALLLAGCVEIEERWTFEPTGAGEYALTLRYDADLLRRVTGVVGEAALREVAGRPFPLGRAALEATLARAEGVTVHALEDTLEAGGWRRVHLRLGFARVADLLRWEPLAGRAFHARSEDREGGLRTRLTMRPIDDLPVLDPLLALLAEAGRERPDPPPGAPAEPGPRERLGLAPAQAEWLEDLLRRALAGVRLAVIVQAPGEILAAGARGAVDPDGAVRQVWDVDALRQGRAVRGVDLAWRRRQLDVPIVAAQE